MELLALTCQHCSAPLQVPAGAKFVTCSHCGTQLAIRKTDSVAYTETLDEIDSRTERMAEQLDDLQRRTAIADLDRQWEMEREQYYVADKHGHRHLPTEGSSIVGGIVITVFGVIWTSLACGIGGAIGNHGGPGIVGLLFPLFGIAFVAFGIWNAFNSFNKAEAYKKAEARYRRQREELLRTDNEQRTHGNE
jgi:LSD1 subclass zinc finger protein